MAETSKYPRGKPFKPPEPADLPATDERAARCQPARSSDAQLRSRTLWMAVSIVGFIFVAAIATFALGVKDVVRPASPPIAAKKTVRRDPPATQSAKAIIHEEEEDTGALKTKPPPEPDQAGLALQTLGTLTAAHLYQTYLNLGLLADATEKGVYNNADARKMLATLTGWIDTVDQQLVKFARGGMGPEDRKKLERVRGVTTLLRTQASELGAYWDTPATDKEGKMGHEKKFHQARQEAWTGIKEMLGIPED